KARGAFLKILQANPEILRNGVIAASAGNHGQGVALAASKATTPATVYTYAGAPAIKINAMKNYGA
ncbi:MAG: pyridoxal-phosphate dependent enzyme, partial [Aliifodinibius sp.]|nr:pyridoxal-phosphate dependent enzyme [candidate division Zixibacteria bacterium]NIT58500.1 pyridoxal-phosphate dependent enzyme [Fodinibius sp.]NIS46914.1 pyridoxal-phosphate dependent enzyme [candidate division Zixibacteria bacterium]NIU15058.1 pyridoxal-phosphate dependent enzyme [candidate division Zixibacteria bacterium]NIV13366.1 pyridoxal-phosphate dependent enzyme [Fodinibius sp.]